MKKLFLLFCLIIFLAGCETVTRFRLDSSCSSDPEKVDDVIHRVSVLLEEEGFKIVEDLPIYFYGITGFSEKDDIEFILKYEHLVTQKGWWIFPEEYDLRHVYIIKHDGILEIVTFSSTRTPMSDINNKIMKEFKEMISNHEMHFITIPYMDMR